MKPSILRWTLLLLATLTVLTAATAAFRSGPGAEVPAKALPPATITYSGTSEPAPDIASTPETPAVVIVDRAPVAPPERRKAREEGYREAREATWEGSLSGQVLSPEGPIPNLTVRVEWVLAHQPDRDEAARLRRIKARRDRDGTWWARALAMTDESGCFVIDGLPAVPLRLHAGNTTLQVQVGGFAQIRTERP